MNWTKIRDGNVWVTRNEIARHFSMSLRTVANLQRRRVLPFVKVGGLVRFNIQHCDRALIKFETNCISDQ